MRARHLSGIAILLLGVGLAGCYNSQWGEAKAEQQHAAARLTPPDLVPLERTAKGSPVTVAVHAFVTPRYMSQVVEARRQFQEAMLEVNRVFAGLVTFRVDSFDPWDGPEDTTDGALAALQSKEKAGPLELHVGLLGSLPRASASFHEIGFGAVLGRHLVVRAPARADEVDAIEHHLDELSTEEREALVKSRRKHRAAAILLHEIGHTLGAIHDDASPSLMNPEYASERSGFSPQNASLVEITIRHRAAKEATDADLARELLDQLDKIGSRGDFVAKDRDDMRVLLTGLRAPTEATRAPAAKPSAPAAPSAPTASDDDLRALTADGRDAFRRAEAALAKNDPAGAWEAGKSLFASQPRSTVVQDLRCRVAMAAFAYDRAIVECETLSQLTRDGLEK